MEELLTLKEEDILLTRHDIAKQLLSSSGMYVYTYTLMSIVGITAIRYFGGWICSCMVNCNH